MLRLTATLDNGSRDSAVLNSSVQQAKECTVYFRRTEDYDGSFGFDWLRTGDTGEPGDQWYRDIIRPQSVYDTFVHSEYKFFDQQWRANNEDYRGTSRYVVPWVTLMPGCSAKFRLKLEVNKPCGELQITMTGGGADSLHPSLSSINAERTGAYYNSSDLTVSCSKAFSAETMLEVRAGDDLVGRMIFVPNSRIHNVDIAIITCKTKSRDTVNELTPSERHLDTVRKLLRQIYVVPNFTHYYIDLTEVVGTVEKVPKDALGRTFEDKLIVRIEDKKGVIKPYKYDKDETRSLFELIWKYNDRKIIATHKGSFGCTHFESIHYYLKKRLYETYPTAITELDGSYKLFFLDDEADCGGKANLEEKSACLFKGFEQKPVTTVHELIHCFGIGHTFSDGATDTLYRQKYLFRAYSTDNIMDYNEEKLNPSDNIKRISLGYWQIKDIWEHLKRD